MTVDNKKCRLERDAPSRSSLENLDSVIHTIRILLGEFVASKNPKYKGLATAGAPFNRGIGTATVRSGEVGVIRLHVKPASHFGFSTREPWRTDLNLEMTYKYSISSQLSNGGRRIDLDPDSRFAP